MVHQSSVKIARGTPVGDGIVATDPRWFDDVAAVYSSQSGAPKRFMTAMRDEGCVRDFLRLGSQFNCKNVLELGCGDNPVSPLLGSGTLNENFTCIDLIPENVERARTSLSRTAIQSGMSIFVDFIAADMRTIPSQLQNQHFSLIVLCESLTHIPPEKRANFLKMWSEKSDAFIIVDRHCGKDKLRAKIPEYLSGPLTRDILQELGFQTLELRIANVQLPGDNEISQYFFLGMRRPSLG